MARGSRRPTHGCLQAPAVMTRLRPVAALLILALASACTSDPAPPSPSPGPGNGGQTITGRERIGWDQRAENAAELATFRYAMYVDGNRVLMAGVTCATTAGQSGFACTGPLPPLSNGSHVLELAAFIESDGIVESTRSSPLQVTVTGLANPSVPALADGETIVSADGVALRAERLIDTLDDVVDAGRASDGSLVVAEASGRMVIDRPDAPPQVLQGYDTTPVVSIALAPDFVESGHLYVLHATDDTFALARYRIVGRQLVERMIVLDGVPASARPSGVVRFGPDGRLYTAFDDAGRPELAARASEWSGKILRMNADGSTPDDQPAASPVVHGGMAAPGGLAWVPATAAMWFADRGADGVERLRALMAGEERPRRAGLRASYALPAGVGAAGLAFHDGSGVPAFAGDLFIAAREGGYLLRVAFDDADRLRAMTSERLLEGRIGSVRAVMIGRDGALVIATANAVWRLRPND